MNHSFKKTLACELGIEAAILYQNLFYWCEKNKANKQNIHDNKAFTYNNHEAFLELFPYMKLNTIKRALKELKKCGLIEVRNDINANKWDKTNHYHTLINPDFLDSYFRSPSMPKENNHHYMSNINTDIYNGEKLESVQIQSNKQPHIQFKEKVNMLFKESKILTFKDKINNCEEGFELVRNLNIDLEILAKEFLNYVIQNKNKASRLNKYLIARAENNLAGLNYEVTNQTGMSKKREEGWY